MALKKTPWLALALLFAFGIQSYEQSDVGPVKPNEAKEDDPSYRVVPLNYRVNRDNGAIIRAQEPGPSSHGPAGDGTTHPSTATHGHDKTTKHHGGADSLTTGPLYMVFLLPSFMWFLLSLAI